MLAEPSPVALYDVTAGLSRKSHLSSDVPPARPENFETRDVPQARRGAPRVTSRVSKFSPAWPCGPRARVRRIHGIATNVCRTFAVFGLALCSQFDTASRAAPILVERCTRALEEQAFADTTLDLYKVYHSSPPNEQTLELRQKLNEGKTGAPRRAWPAGRSCSRAIAPAINSRRSCHDVRLAGCKNVEARHQMHALHCVCRAPPIAPLAEGARKARVRALTFCATDRDFRDSERASGIRERPSDGQRSACIRRSPINPNIYACTFPKLLLKLSLGVPRANRSFPK